MNILCVNYDKKVFFSLSSIIKINSKEKTNNTYLIFNIHHF